MVTSVPTYDGFTGLKNPLQNRKLNALLSDYCQRAEAGTMTREFEVIVLKALKEAHFIAPIHGAEDVDTGEHKEISFNYLIGQHENEDGVQELIGFAFTDNFQLEDCSGSMDILNKARSVHSPDFLISCLLTG